jgi:hypothetical protein
MYCGSPQMLCRGFQPWGSAEGDIVSRENAALSTSRTIVSVVLLKVSGDENC